MLSLGWFGFPLRLFRDTYSLTSAYMAALCQKAWKWYCITRYMTKGYYFFSPRDLRKCHRRKHQSSLSTKSSMCFSLPLLKKKLIFIALKKKILHVTVQIICQGKWPLTLSSVQSQEDKQRIGWNLETIFKVFSLGSWKCLQVLQRHSGHHNLSSKWPPVTQWTEKSVKTSLG